LLLATKIAVTFDTWKGKVELLHCQITPES